MMEIWVIGTEPPCVRCQLLSQRVEEALMDSGWPATLKRMSFRDVQAKSWAEGLGYGLGTAKEVSRKTPVEADWGRIAALSRQPWSPELEEALRPCYEGAEKARILMTPVLVINGKLKHWGGVPKVEQIKARIKEELNLRPRTGQTKPVRIEAFIGHPPCPGCQELEALCLEMERDLGERLALNLYRGRAAQTRFEELGLKVVPAIVIENMIKIEGVCPSKETLRKALKEVGLEGEDIPKEQQPCF
jgi:hypothetical protein